jgi:hypothetical protein
MGLLPRHLWAGRAVILALATVAACIGGLCAPAGAEERVLIVDHPDAAAANDHYAGNCPPLLRPMRRGLGPADAARGWSRRDA